MTVLFVAPAQFPAEWRDTFNKAFSHEGICWWPDRGDSRSTDCLIMSKGIPEALACLPNLRLISSTGMGIDHILALPNLPAGVPVVRVANPSMVKQIAQYVTLAVLRVEHDSDRFDSFQQNKIWARRFHRRPGGMLRIGLLGFGTIGQEVARQLRFLDFTVTAWTRSPRPSAEIPTYQGPTGLQALCSQSDIVIDTLPATKATAGIIDSHFLARLPRGAHIINIGRGEHVVEQDLLTAIDRNHLSGATLDVFATEPLPSNHPFWTHPRIRITPHSAGTPDPRETATAILENLRRARDGEALLNEINRAVGY